MGKKKLLWFGDNVVMGVCPHFKTVRTEILKRERVLKQFNIYTAGWERVQEYVVYVSLGTQLETTRHQVLQTSESLFFRKKLLSG